MADNRRFCKGFKPLSSIVRTNGALEDTGKCCLPKHLDPIPLTDFCWTRQRNLHFSRKLLALPLLYRHTQAFTDMYKGAHNAYIHTNIHKCTHTHINTCISMPTAMPIGYHQTWVSHRKLILQDALGVPFSPFPSFPISSALARFLNILGGSADHLGEIYIVCWVIIES